MFSALFKAYDHSHGFKSVWVLDLNNDTMVETRYVDQVGTVVSEFHAVRTAL